MNLKKTKPEFKICDIVLYKEKYAVDTIVKDGKIKDNWLFRRKIGTIQGRSGIISLSTREELDEYVQTVRIEREMKKYNV